MIVEINADTIARGDDSSNTGIRIRIKGAPEGKETQRALEDILDMHKYEATREEKAWEWLGLMDKNETKEVDWSLCKLGAKIAREIEHQQHQTHENPNTAEEEVDIAMSWVNVGEEEQARKQWKQYEGNEKGRDNRAEMIFGECANETWETDTPTMRAAIEALEECVATRDIDALDASAEALGENTKRAYVLAGEVGEHLEKIDNGNDREQARTLARMWRNTLRDEPLTTSLEREGKMREWCKDRALANTSPKGRIAHEEGGRTPAQREFDPWGGKKTGALARARLDQKAIEILGYAAQELPEDEAGYDSIRVALTQRGELRPGTELGAPLHERLAQAKEKFGFTVREALIIEQAFSGRCLDVPHESTIATIRSIAMNDANSLEGHREQTIRTILSAGRKIAIGEEPTPRNKREVQPKGLREKIQMSDVVEPEMKRLVHKAFEAGEKAGVGEMKRNDIRLAITMSNNPAPKMLKNLIRGTHVKPNNQRVGNRRVGMTNER